eukprot:PhM_4_TR5272/c0_g1_i1/m.98980
MLGKKATSWFILASTTAILTSAGVYYFVAKKRRRRGGGGISSPVLSPVREPTNIMNLFQQLANVRCFSTLPLSTITQLVSVMQERCFEADTTLIHYGDTGDECYLLLAGIVEVVNKDGEYVTTIPPSAFFGEMALLNNSLRSATVVTRSPGRVLVLRRDNLFDLIDKFPVMREAMQKEVIRRNVEERFTSQQRRTPEVLSRIFELVEAEFERAVRDTDEESRVKWRKGHKLGVGAFGAVYSAINLDTGETMAVKLCKGQQLRQALTNNKLVTPQQEAQRLQALSHPNLLKVYGFEVDPGSGDSFMFMELMAGSLKGRVREFGPLPEHVVRDYAKQLLLGLQHLHQKGILHRDVKPDNMLINAAGVVKLADFGLSRDSLQFETVGICGTPAYMSPECIRGRYGIASDIWALGCSLIELLSADAPWSEVEAESTTQLMYAIATSRLGPALPREISTECADFLEKTLLIDARQRWDASSLLEHEWLSRSDRDGSSAHLTPTRPVTFQQDKELHQCESDGFRPDEDPTVQYELTSEAKTIEIF